MPSKKQVEEQRDEYRARLEQAYDLFADALGYNAEGDDDEDEDEDEDETADDE